MTTVYITPIYKKYDRTEEIDHDWHTGDTFKLYNGGPVTCNDTLKLRMAGCTILYCCYKTKAEDAVLRHEIRMDK